MTAINVARIAKVLALAAFVLPWAAVSCNNVDVATASGIELIQGTMTQNPDAQRQFGERMGDTFGPGLSGIDGGISSETDNGAMGAMGDVPDLGINFFGIAAAAIILIGLALSFIGAPKSAARNVMITSLLGIALCFGTVWWWKEQLKTESGKGEEASAASPFGGSGMDAMGGGMLDTLLQERFGYWLALSALAVAAGAGAIGMSGGAGAARPDEPPAA